MYRARPFRFRLFRQVFWTVLCSQLDCFTYCHIRTGSKWENARVTKQTNPEDE